MIEAIIRVDGKNYVGLSDYETIENKQLGGFGFGESTVSKPIFSASEPAKIIVCQMNIESTLRKIFHYFTSTNTEFKKIEVIKQ